MLTKLIAYSVRNPLIIALGVVVMMAFGWRSMSQIPLDAVPDITNNQVQIVTQSPSLTAEEVEQFITYPLELSMTNLPGVEEVRSISKYGLSILTVIFEEDVQDLAARQLVAEQITMASQEIPAGLGVPEMMPITTGLGEIYQYVLRVTENAPRDYSLSELRTLQDWVVKRQLSGIQGIIEISSFGGDVMQYEVVPNPSAMNAFGLTLNDLELAIASNNASTGGSYYSENNQSFYIRANGRVAASQDLNQIPVKSSGLGSTVALRDVAVVKEGKAVRFGAMTMDGKGEVVGGITLMLKGDNANATVRRVRDRVALLQKSLPEGIVLEPYLDRSALVSRTTATVSKNLIEGGLIVIFVLVLLLGNWRAGLVVASVIPLAMLFALILMNSFGVSANLMSLGAIDFGIVVDGAVIVTEHLLAVLAVGYLGKKLTRNEFQEVVIHSAQEMIKSAVFGVIIILVVFVPIITLIGIEGKMFRPMALTVSFALAGALMLSVTYVPAMLALVLKKEGAQEPRFSRFLVEKLVSAYLPALNWALDRPRSIMVGALGLFAATVFTFLQMGSEFIPKLDEGDLAVQLQLPAGTSLEESIATTTLTEQTLKAHFPQIKHVVSKIGTAEVPTDPMSIEQADIMIIMNPESSWPEKIEKDVLVNQMSETLGATIPFAEFEFTQPIELRFNELISGAKSDIAIKVFGPDFTVLSELADQMVPIVQDIAGAVDVKREMTDGLNQRHVVYDRSKMALYGVRVAEANAAIEAAFAGHVVSEIFESDRKFDVVVRFDESLRRSPDLNALTVLSMEGEVVPFSAFATLEYHSGPSMISRENSQRRVVVGANVRGRDIESVVLEIQQELETKMDLPPGYYLNYGGDFQQLQEAKKRLGVAVPAALVAIYILLYLSFRSIRLATIVFASVPLSTIGGVAALWFRGMPFSISAGIGFIALFGVAVLNGIVMISHLNKLNQGSSERESLVASALQRMRPVVMTALVAALGFLPMALSTGAGAEVQKPLATVVIGGLISATLLTLVVLPVIYRRFAGSNKTLLAVLALVVFIPNANAQEVRSLLDARVQLAKYSTEIKRSEGKLQQVSALNASDWDLPLTLNHQRGQINGLDRGDYFTTAEVQLPSFASVPSLAALHRARIENATNEVAYVRAFTDYKLENLWIRLDEAIAILNVREREYKKADMIMERILQRVALGIVPSRDSVVFGAIEEALHHGVKEQQVVVDQLQAAIAALVGWEGVLQWTPEPAILNYSTAPQITQDESLLLAPTAASVATYKAQTRVEKSYLVPALGVGVFNQRMDGLSGFNGIQFSTSIGLNPVATAKRIKYAELDYLDAELEFEQAVREWNAITQQLSAQLDRWSKDNHHIAPAQTHDVDYWMLYEAGALDLQALWSVYASGFEQELLSIEHEHAYAQAVLNWNFYQKALK